MSTSDFTSVLPFCQLDEYSFNAALYKLAHRPLNFNTNHLETSLFNPLNHSTFSPFSDLLDPDCI